MAKPNYSFAKHQKEMKKKKKQEEKRQRRFAKAKTDHSDGTPMPPEGGNIE